MSEKTDIRIDLATDAVIKVLEHYSEISPDQFLSKKKLFPRVIQRVESIMETENLPIYDELAIPPPDDRFLYNKWPNICTHAAERYCKYIYWGQNGVKLGTLEDYQKIISDKLVPIEEGIAKNARKRGRIIIKQGGQTIVITVGVRLLGSGEIIADVEDE